LTIPEKDIQTISWSADSKRLAVSSHWKVIYVWDIVANVIRFKLTTSDPLVAAYWSPDGQHVAAIGGDRGSFKTFVSVWNAAQGTVEMAKDTSALFIEVSRMAWSPDSTKIALGVGPSEKRPISILDVTTQQFLDGYGLHVTTISALAWSPDGKKIISASAGVEEGSLQLSDANTHAMLWRKERSQFDENFTDAVWNPNGLQLLVLTTLVDADHFQSTIHVLNPVDGTETAVLPLPPI
jgi:WD40 repeat protein